MNTLKKMLAVLLFISLGATTACGDDDDNKDNKNPQTNPNPDTNSGPKPVTANTQLKDLTPAQVATLCLATTKKSSELEDPATEPGKTLCLIAAVDDSYDEDDSDEDNIDYCEFHHEGCLDSPPFKPYEECMTPTDCTATVAEFEKCSDDFHVKLKAGAIPFENKTCSDYATEAGIDGLEAFFDAVYDEPIEACKTLYEKCPNLDDYLNNED